MLTAVVTDRQNNDFVLPGSCVAFSHLRHGRFEGALVGTNIVRKFHAVFAQQV
jgi:hypothetical protein